MARTGRNCRGRNRFVRTGAIVTVPEVVDGKSELAWIKDTFEQVNNGRHPDFTLPRRIDIGLWAALDAFTSDRRFRARPVLFAKRRAASVPVQSQIKFCRLDEFG